MKTTVEISDALLDAARAIAARQGVTLRALVEQGLRRLVAESGAQASFKLRDASFNGQGLRPELQGADWTEIRDRAYEGRGA